MSGIDSSNEFSKGAFLLEEFALAIFDNQPVVRQTMKACVLRAFLKTHEPNVGSLSLVLNNILKSHWSMSVFLGLQRYNILELIFPEISILEKICQDKMSASDVFVHTLLVLNMVDKTFPDNIDLKIAALYHDTGKTVYWKDGNFHRHAIRSVNCFLANCYKWPMVNGESRKRIETIIKFHMLPLAYQRDVNWGVNAIKRFIKATQPFTLDVIDFSICDKSSNSTLGIEILKDFKQIVSQLL